MADDSKHEVSRKDAVIRRAALLLSGLVLSPDNALERYRDKRAGDPRLDVEHLRRARDILDAVGFAIAAGEPERWSAVEQAWESLRKDAAKVPELPEEVAATKPAARAATATSAGAQPPEQSAGQPPDRTPPDPASGDAAAEQSRPPSLAREEGPEDESQLPAWQGEPPRASAAPLPSGVPKPPSPLAAPPASPPQPAPPQPLSPLRPVGPPGIPGSVEQPGRSPAVEQAADQQINETAEVDLAQLQLGERALPFEGAAKAPPSAADDLPPLKESDIDQTAALGVKISLEEALPFDMPSSAKAPELTLEQYASYRAECAVTPDHAEAIRKCYGVAGEKAHRALEREWTERLAAKPDERQRVTALQERFEAWLRRQRQG